MPEPIEVIVPLPDDGVMDRTNARYLNDCIRRFAGGDVEIRISRPTRTTRANAYYWGAVLTPIRDKMYDVGMGPVSTWALHEEFKELYLPVRTEVVFGKDRTLTGSTTKLSQTEFSDYIEKIKSDERVIALGIHFPDEEYEFDSYDIADQSH